MPEFVVIKHLPLTSPEFFFGRDEELVWLEKCWTERAFVASISAWGGVGKTSLVTKWLCAMRDAGWPGAERVFVWSFYGQGMRTAGSSDGFLAAALVAFGDPDPLLGSPWEKGERLARLIQEKRTLLVLDGVEPMQWGPGEQEGRFKDPALQMLVQGLAVDNKGLLLLTSRLPVRDAAGLAGEKVRARELKHLSPDAGVALLRARNVHGTDDDLRQASTEYDGHALALTLLGSYLEDIADGDIRRRHEIGSLFHDEREGGHARRVMASYEPLLGQTERAILRILGLFDRPAKEEEIAALRADPVVPGLTDALVGVAGRDWNKALSKLRRIGLIGAKTGTDLDAHPLVRQHFGELLRDENIDAFREGHWRLYEFLRTNTKEFPETIAEMEPLYKAVVHGCLAGKHQEALDEVWWKRIQRGEQHFYTQTLAAFGHEVATLAAFFDPPWERIASGLSERDQAFVLNNAGFALRALGRLEEAARLMRLSMQNAVALEQWTNAAQAACNLCELLQSRGALREALASAVQSVELADKSGDAFHRLFTRTTQAAVQHAMGPCDEALALFKEAQRMQKEDQPEYPLLYSLQGFRYCDLLLDLGREAEVLRRAANALTIATENNWLPSIALDHLSLGRAHLTGLQRGTGGDLTEATAHLQRAVERLPRAGMQHHVPLGLLARAELYIHTREFANARRDIDEAITIATRCGFRLHECDAHLGYARLAIAEGNRGKSSEHLEKARKIVEETGYHRRDGELAALETQIAAMPKPDQTTNKISNLSHETNTERMSNMTNINNESFDIAIICALHDPEFDKVRRAAPGAWEPVHIPNDSTTYEKTTYTTKTGRILNVIGAAASQMGMPASAVLATKMILHFRPKLVAMVGIAAGVSSEKQGFGNILTPFTTFDYASGKIFENEKEKKLEFAPDPKPLEIRRRIQDRLAYWRRERVQLDDICNLWGAELPPTRLNVHTEPVGSGPSVLGTSKPILEIHDHWRKLGGIEMEAHGVHLACHDADVAFLCAKSICDFADKKEDRWQHYAAFTAAQFCYRFLIAEWETLGFR